MRNHHRVLITTLTLLGLGATWKAAHGADSLQVTPPPPPLEITFAPFPAPLQRVAPEYPRAARDAGVQGIVWLRVRIDSTGSVKSMRISRSIPALDTAAVEAVSGWKFSTRMPDGRPAPAEFDVPVEFSLDRRSMTLEELSRIPVRNLGGPDSLRFRGSRRDSSRAPQALPPIPESDNTIAPYPDPRGAMSSAGDELVIDEPPVVLHRVAPVRPAGMKRGGHAVTVRVSVLVGLDGKARVLGAILGGGAAGLDSTTASSASAAASEAVKHWQFRPALSQGRPVVTFLTIPVKF